MKSSNHFPIASAIARCLTGSIALLFFAACPSAGTSSMETCAAGLATCSGACVNTSNDASHCGSCTMMCAAGQVCDNGSCTATCSALTTKCGSSCVNTSTDPIHCGSCTNTCRSDQVCSGGACGCAAGQSVCSGVCSSSCGAPGTGGNGNVGTGGRGSPGTGGSGSPATGGSGNPGTGGGTQGTGGAGGISAAPAGYFSSGSFRGCAWTGVDVVANTDTANMPRDFLTKPATTPYCVSGHVYQAYESVALLGFNLNEAPTGDAAQCAYKPADPTKVGPPGVSLMNMGTGLAVSYTRLTGSNIRVQIQGPNGGMTGPTGENDRWCYTITKVQGPIFAPFNQFNTRCWDGSGTNYAGQLISAVSFLVPGVLIPSPFNYCIGGFAVGSSVAAAPAYSPMPYPTLTGTIGGPGPMDLDFQRVKVAAPGVGGKAYIVQNNNWGTPNGTDQTIRYSGNSFTIMSTTGNVTGAGVPASFPSVYIGADGDTQEGVFSTTGDGDNLPRQISAIQSINTTMRYSAASGDYNATYDVWLASGAPTSAYSDAISGFVMVWLYRPAGRNPIGTMVRTASIGGNTYDVFVGPRGTGTNPNRPVVSYVANPNGVLSRTFDLKPILADAAMNGIPSTWYVTDIFAGFEIWTGGSASNLSLQEFSATVQ